MSLISIGANCGKHTGIPLRGIAVLFSPLPSRECSECQSGSARGHTRITRHYYARLSPHMHLNFYGTFTFPCRFLFSPILPFPTRVVPRTENNARDPTPINWFLRDICNFLAARLSPVILYRPLHMRAATSFSPWRWGAKPGADEVMLHLHRN